MSTEVSTTRELLTGWGLTAASATDVADVATPAAAVAALAHAGRRGVIARGLGRAYGDAAQNAGGLVVRDTAMAQVHDLDVDTATVRVDAGISLESLMRHFVPLGLFPKITPGTCQVTVGGAIAADIHGKNHHEVGSFCDHVTSLTLQTPTGELVCTPDGPHADVFWATAGGMGLTGIVTEATIRMKRIATSRVRVDTERAGDLDDLMARMEGRDHEYHYSVAWIDCLATGRQMGRGVLTRGDFATVDELDPADRRDPLAFAPSTLVAAPPWIPNGLLNGLTARAFNELWFRKAPKHQVGAIQPLAAFHHPLDFVSGWNRIYGSRGFLQYQFVVPFGPEGDAALRTAVERLSKAGYPAFLAVLKRFGPGNDGMLSFPTPGWTLALDVPTSGSGLAELLDDLDRLVLSVGGRLYLAKESRAKAATIAAMYPRLDEFRKLQATLDPDGVLNSDLARRLDLLGR